MSRLELVVVVHGRPAPQGSKRHVGHGVMVESSKHVRPWRALVTAATTDALAAIATGDVDNATAYTLSAVFTLPRPTSHYRTGRNADQLKPSAPTSPATTPDLDKLLRSTLDGIADAGAVANDSRIVAIVAAKTFPGGHPDALDHPGAVIVLRAAP